MTNDRVLVLGGTGFLGSSIVCELIKRNVPTVVLSRNTVSSISDATQIIRADVNDFDSLQKAMVGCRWVVHAAGYYPLYSVAREQQAQQALIELRNVLKAAYSVGVERFVFTSSPMALVREPRAFERCTYHYIKKLMHDEVLQWIDMGFQGIIAIPGACFGPGDWKPTTGRLIIEIANRRLRFIIEGKMNAVDGRDVANAEVEMLWNGSIGEAYQLGNWNCYLSEFASLAASLSEVPKPKMQFPYELARFTARTMETVQFHLGASQPLFPECGVDQIYYGTHLDSSLAVKELGFRPRPIAETVIDTIRYFYQRGLLKSKEGSVESQLSKMHLIRERE